MIRFPLTDFAIHSQSHRQFQGIDRSGHVQSLGAKHTPPNKNYKLFELGIEWVHRTTCRNMYLGISGPKNARRRAKISATDVYLPWGLGMEGRH